MHVILAYLPYLLLPWSVSVWVPVFQVHLPQIPGTSGPFSLESRPCVLPAPTYLGVGPALLSVTLSSTFCPVLHSSCCLYTCVLSFTQVLLLFLILLAPLPIVSVLNRLLLFATDLTYYNIWLVPGFL